VDSICNELGLTIPVAIHADHFGIKQESDMDLAKVEFLPFLYAGITSIAVDASHMMDDKICLPILKLTIVFLIGQVLRQKSERSRELLVSRQLMMLLFLLKG